MESDHAVPAQVVGMVAMVVNAVEQTEVAMEIVEVAMGFVVVMGFVVEVAVEVEVLLGLGAAIVACPRAGRPRKRVIRGSRSFALASSPLLHFDRRRSTT